MAALSALLAPPNSFPDFTRLFARETEPDLDFDEDLDELEDSPSHSYSPKGPGKKSGKSPLMWIIILLIVAGGGYLAMNPDMVMDMLGGETAPPPPMVVKPAPKPPVATQPKPAAPVKVTPIQPAPSLIPSPQFNEGQIVSVNAGQAGAGGPLTLHKDASGLQAGPSVKPGSMVTVLDGSLENNVWVYFVKTKAGETGWISGKQLLAKP